MAISLTGHLDLLCGLDARGISSVRRQSFRAPIHLSKPHLDAETLVVNVVNPTAGLLAGDRIDIAVRVEGGARLLLTAPSASRAHCSGEGFAQVTQEFAVEPGGWLEVLPELFIPQGGARYRQVTKARVESDGELLFFETLAPGRVAMGEVFAYAALDWETELFLRGERIARERYRLEPRSESVAALRRQFSTAYYASCFAISPNLPPDLPARLEFLHNGDAWCGCGALPGEGAWVIKMLAANSVLLRRQMAALRLELHALLGRIPPALRRAG